MLSDCIYSEQDKAASEPQNMRKHTTTLSFDGWVQRWIQVWSFFTSIQVPELKTSGGLTGEAKVTVTTEQNFSTSAKYVGVAR